MMTTDNDLKHLDLQHASNSLLSNTLLDDEQKHNFPILIYFGEIANIVNLFFTAIKNEDVPSDFFAENYEGKAKVMIAHTAEKLCQVLYLFGKDFWQLSSDFDRIPVIERMWSRTNADMDYLDALLIQAICDIDKGSLSDPDHDYEPLLDTLDALCWDELPHRIDRILGMLDDISDEYQNWK